jgi:MinD superfamily P-loop ATPase
MIMNVEPQKVEQAVIHQLQQVIDPETGVDKVDVNPGRAAEVRAFCASRGIEVVGHIPFDTVVTEAMVQGQPVTAYADGVVTEALRRAWEGVKAHLTLKTID